MDRCLLAAGALPAGQDPLCTRRRSEAPRRGTPRPGHRHLLVRGLHDPGHVGRPAQGALWIPPADHHAGFRPRSQYRGSSRRNIGQRYREAQVQRLSPPPARTRGIFRPGGGGSLCRQGRETPVHRLHGPRLRELPRNGGPRMVRPRGAGDPAQRLCHLRPLLGRQEGAARGGLGHDRCRKGPQESREDQLLLRAEDLRCECTALLRPAGPRRETAGRAPRV